MDPGILPLSEGMSLVGEAVIVQGVPGDNITVIKAMAECESVLVITENGKARCSCYKKLDAEKTYIQPVSIKKQ